MINMKQSTNWWRVTRGKTHTHTHQHGFGNRLALALDLQLLHVTLDTFCNLRVSVCNLVSKLLKRQNKNAMQ